jgi:predicted RecB family nuclease
VQKFKQMLVFSPTDLTTFMTSPFASWMNRFALENPSNTPTKDAEDAFNKLLADKGIQHENQTLLQFKSQGLNVINIESVVSETHKNISHKVKATQEAMSSGIDVIFQGVLNNTPFRGHADFLVKVPGVSKLGDYHYEVWDTKLALSVKPEFVVQLCCYVDMLESFQGCRASHIVIALGNGINERLSTEDYFHYYLALKSKFLAEQVTFDINAMPDPADSKNYGIWSQHAEKILHAKDHLSLVANITRSQIKKLNAADIATSKQLSQLSVYYIKGISRDSLKKIKAQADIQLKSSISQALHFEILIPAVRHAKVGLALLPPHSKLDVFFDMEGYPLDNGGLEYLWGCSYLDGNNILYKDFWAHNRDKEKIAFKSFIDWVYARWQLDPTMHIYHYANYEVEACKKLMNRYGICEYEVDQLLRNNVFIDLYKIVKTGLRIGEPKYSIKNIEKLYRTHRQTTVSSGGDSVVMYESWRTSNELGLEGNIWQKSKSLLAIRDYNEDDCDSTQELTDWLRNQQSNHGITYIGNQEIVNPELNVLDLNRTALRDQLLEKAKNEIPEQARITINLAHTLEFHHREKKSISWRLFDRMSKSVEELEDDIGCLANCVRTKTPAFQTPQTQKLAYEYKFNPDQEFKIPGQTSMLLLGIDMKNVTYLSEFSNLSIGLCVVRSEEDPGQVITLIPNEFVNPAPIELAIDDVVAKYKSNGLEGTAIIDFLRRVKPRINHRHGGPIVSAVNSKDRLNQVIEAVSNLNNSYLTIQGPPGAGKTYTGKHIITALVKSGKRIGISSNSHKAINNLLVGVAEQCKADSVSVNCYCSRNTGPEINANSIVVIANGAIQKKLKDGCVVGTTAWGFCREELIDAFDYLFIDEAGQVSVANLIGMSRSAKNIVLMGDQMQLGQPSQGAHPEESGLSILDYLLHESPIIRDDMGVFLNTTFRMHENVNDYISHAIYKGQLQVDADNNRQSVIVPASYVGPLDIDAGVMFIPIAHEGNTQASDEEVIAIKELATECLKRDFIDKTGAKRRITLQDILVVAPYNHQVNKLKQALGEHARVGSVDKFQGQEAPIVFFSLCTSDPSESPRGIDFLFDIHRINVAISRAQALAIVVGNQNLLCPDVSSVKQLSQVNVMSRLLPYVRKNSYTQ